MASDIFAPLPVPVLTTAEGYEYVSMTAPSRSIVSLTVSKLTITRAALSSGSGVGARGEPPTGVSATPQPARSASPSARKNAVNLFINQPSLSQGTHLTQRAYDLFRRINYTT